MSFVIRPPLPQDAEALTAMVCQPGVAHGLGILTVAGPGWVKARLEKKDANIYAFVAVVEGNAVGWVRLIRLTDRKSHSATLEIAVRDDQHGKGIGRALLREALDVADNGLGLRRIELEVFCDNPAAQALYESEGFVVEGTRQGVILSAGALIDAHVMARLIWSKPDSEAI